MIPTLQAGLGTREPVTVAPPEEGTSDQGECHDSSNQEDQEPEHNPEPRATTFGSYCSAHCATGKQSEQKRDKKGLFREILVCGPPSAEPVRPFWDLDGGRFPSFLWPRLLSPRLRGSFRHKSRVLLPQALGVRAEQRHSLSVRGDLGLGGRKALFEAEGA